MGTFVGWTISPSTVCDAISVEDGAMGSTGRTPDEDLLDLAEEDVVLLDFPELLVFSDFISEEWGREKEEPYRKDREEMTIGTERRVWVDTRPTHQIHELPTFEVIFTTFFACFALVGFDPIALEDFLSVL